MLKKLNWQAFTGDDRNEIIQKIKEVISRSDGYILNFNMFSDFALSLSIEIEENRIFELHQSLSHILKVSDFDTKHINSDFRKE